MAEKLVKPDTSIAEAISAISQDNSGALKACSELVWVATYVDPSCSKIDYLLLLDSLSIYGRRIWLLFESVCGQHPGKMIAILRATELNLLSKKSLDHAIDNDSEGLKLEVILEQVKERLPGFKINPWAAA